MKKITFLLAFFLFLTESKAQAVSGYAFSQSTETYAAVTGTNSTATEDDGIQNNIPIGFAFNYGGVSYSTFSISTNGWIRLGQNIGNQSWINTLANPNAAYAPLIAAFWDDHNRGTGSIAYSLTGSTPSRTLEIGWDNVNISNGGGTSATAFGSFKMRLHETTGIVDFVYGSMIPGGQLSASIGLNDATSFLSVTAAAASTASSAAANNNVTGINFLPGQKFTFTPQPQCSGAPVPGHTVSSLVTVCENVIFGLSIENTSTDFGISYQWQTSQNGNDFTDIANATGPTYNASQSASTYYRCVVTCGANAVPSTPVQVLQTNAAMCHCLPTYDNGKTDGDLISNVVIVGTTLSNNTGNAPIDPYYTYFVGQPNYTATLEVGYSYQMDVSVGTYGQQEIAVWIDYNDDYQFSEDEKIGYTQEQVAGNGTGTFAITLSCDAPIGVHRMRIRDAWNTDATTMEPCANYGYGETEDYDIQIVSPNLCQAPYQLSIGDVSSTGGTLTWAIGCANGWDVFVYPAGSPAPTSGSIPTFSGLETNTAQILELQPNTAYDVYVQAICLNSSVSELSAVFTFTTLPLAVANDDCETATELTPGANFAENAVIATNVGATKTLGQPNPTCGIFGFGGDVWFKVVVPEDGNVTIEVQADPGSPLTDTALMAFTGTCAGGLTSLGCSDDEGVDAFSILNLTGLTPGATIYARVWEYANDTFGTFQVSAWNQSLKTKGFDETNFGYYPNPVKDYLHLSYGQKMTDVAVFNLLGQQVFAKAINSSQDKIDLSHLAKGAYLVRVNAENQTKTIKIIKE
ncbi:GEVED domain-containing protein [Flavobacterium sp.]|uniref:GEVED domain-containing protein n=1 Tax=Flavobacterium sp. TaxID=239 RepID=UPI0039E34CD9